MNPINADQCRHLFILTATGAFFSVDCSIKCTEKRLAHVRKVNDSSNAINRYD
jgi:hypothetical protein